MADEKSYDELLCACEELLSDIRFNAEKMGPEEKQELVHLLKRLSDLFLPAYELLEEHYSSLISSALWGVGGYTVFRGYCCPSPVYDISIGRVSRGKLSKTKPTNKDPYYQYLYNDKQQITKIIDYVRDQKVRTEYLLYFHGYRLGITYEHRSYGSRNRITTTAIEVRERDRIRELILCLFNSFRCEPSEINMERFTYDGDHVGEMLLDHFLVMKMEPFSVHSREKFYYKIKDGYYSEMAFTGSRSDPEERIEYYGIKKRRRIDFDPERETWKRGVGMGFRSGTGDSFHVQKG